MTARPLADVLRWKHTHTNYVEETEALLREATIRLVSPRTAEVAYPFGPPLRFRFTPETPAVMLRLPVTRWGRKPLKRKAYGPHVLEGVMPRTVAPSYVESRNVNVLLDMRLLMREEA